MQNFYQKLQAKFSFTDSNQGALITFLYIVVAFCFAILARAYWVYWAGGIDVYNFDGHLMINTNDGYYWAEGARDILSGTHQLGDLSPINTPLSIILAFFASFLPFSFESIMLWMSAVFGSLIVVPLVLIGKVFNKPAFGFVAALLGSIAHSYYNRTMAGYLDTDLLVVVLPTFVVYFAIFISKKERGLTQGLFLLLLGLNVIFYRWFYAGSYSLLLAMVAATIIYALIFDRRSINFVIATIILGTGFLPEVWQQAVFGIAFVGAFYYLKAKQIWLIGAVFLAVFVFLGFNDIFNPILMQLDNYVFRSSVEQNAINTTDLKFFSVVQTVMEAGAIPFETFVYRISGSYVGFFVSLIGVIFMLIRYPVLLIATPMLALGGLAYTSGLRFTVYAVPVMALGFAFFVFWFGAKIYAYTSSNRLKLGFVGLASILMLVPNLMHIVDYKMSSVFFADEANLLVQSKDKVNRNDYFISWWDYGFPIRYYSDVKTLIDGARHSGSNNYSTSLILTTPNQEQAGKLARLEVEQNEKQIKEATFTPNIQGIYNDYLAANPDKNLSIMEFVRSLGSLDISNVKKTVDVYLYLPQRMLSVFGVLSKFSDLDLQSGENYKNRYYRYAWATKQDTQNGILAFSDGSYLDAQKGLVVTSGAKVKLKKYIQVVNDKNLTPIAKTQNIHPDGKLNIIDLQYYGVYLILDDATLNSTLIQLFVFENYNPNVFTPVSKSKSAKIYKLRY